LRLVDEIWNKRFNSDCPEALLIAALYHDVDRVFPIAHSDDPNIKTGRRMFDSRSIPDHLYGHKNGLKEQNHPTNCSEIFKDYNPDIPENLLSDIMFLIQRHESGGEDVSGSRKDFETDSFLLADAADVLKEADGLSFFDVILPSYVKDKPKERVLRKIDYSHRKLSSEGVEIVSEMDFGVVKHNGITYNLKQIVEEGINYEAKAINPQEVMRVSLLASTLEPIPEKLGCTTRQTDLSDKTKFEYFVMAGINSAQSFHQLAQRIIDNGYKQPNHIFDLAYQAQVESIRNRNGGKINWGLIMMNIPIITSQFVYSNSNVYDATVDVLKNTTKQDVASLKQLWTMVKGIDGRQMPPSETFAHDNVHAVYANFPNSRRTEEIWHDHYISGMPLSKQAHGIITDGFKEGKFLSLVTEAYNEILPDCGNVPGIAADFVAAAMYTSIFKIGDKKLI
jgi:hypothetical protein